MELFLIILLGCFVYLILPPERGRINRLQKELDQLKNGASKQSVNELTTELHELKKVIDEIEAAIATINQTIASKTEKTSDSFPEEALLEKALLEEIKTIIQNNIEPVSPTSIAQEKYLQPPIVSEITEHKPSLSLERSKTYHRHLKIDLNEAAPKEESLSSLDTHQEIPENITPTEKVSRETLPHNILANKEVSLEATEEPVAHAAITESAPPVEIMSPQLQRIMRYASTNQSAEVALENPIITAGSSYISKFFSWFFRENPLIKLGIVILFFGFGFLLKLGFDKGLFPIEMRLIATAGISFTLFVIGWRMRHKRPDFALSLQGAGLGGIYFILYAATKIFTILSSPQLTLIGMMIICAAIIALSIAQRSQMLAFIAILGGFMAPPLMSTGGGSFLHLYAFYTAISVAIVVITLRFSWQYLHALGFTMMFGVSSLIGFAKNFMGLPLGIYQPDQFFGVTTLVVLNMAIYGCVLLIINRIHFEKEQSLFEGKYTYQFNTALLLGTPIIGFGLLYLLLKPYEYGIAWAALALGIGYLALGYLFRQIKSISLASEYFFFTTLGLGFLTLSIPLAYSTNITAIIWAIEGAVFLLVNHKEIPRTSYLMGTALIIFSALHCVYLILQGGFHSIETTTIWINAITLLIAAWRWTFNDEEEFVGYLQKLIAHKKVLSETLSISAHVFWIAALVSLAFEPWLNTRVNGFSAPIFIFLGLLPISGGLFSKIRLHLNWTALIRFEYALVGLGILTTFGLMIQTAEIGYLHQAGFLNAAWILIFGWMALFTREHREKGLKNADFMSILTITWALWVANQFLVAFIPTHYLIVIEGLLLSTLSYTRHNFRIRFLGTCFVILGGPLFIINNAAIAHMYTTIDYGILLLLTLPVIYTAFLHEQDSSETDVAEQQWIIKGALIVAGTYLFFTLNLWSAYVSNNYREEIALISILSASIAFYFGARLLKWDNLKILCHLLLIQIGVTLFAQFSSLYLSYKPIDLAKNWGIITLMVIALISYYALLKELINRYNLLIGSIIHAILGIIGVALMFNSYFLLCDYLDLDASIVALYTFAIPVLIYSYLPNKIDWIAPYKQSYQLLVFPLCAINLMLIVMKFFSAPIVVGGIFIPILNPLEMGILINGAIISYCLVVNMKLFNIDHVTNTLSKQPFVLCGAILLILTMTVTRMFSVYAEIEWIFIELWQSRMLQALMSIIWTLFAMITIIISQRKQSYEYWLAGTIPLAAVVIKLFLVDISKGGGEIRAVLFVSIALLLIAIGYFAPMPPLRKDKQDGEL